MDDATADKIKWLESMIELWNPNFRDYDVNAEGDEKVSPLLYFFEWVKEEAG